MALFSSICVTGRLRSRSGKHHTKPVVIVGFTRVVVEVEHASIIPIVVVAPAFKPRVRRINKVRDLMT